MAEEEGKKKGGKLKKFFLFAMIAGAVAGVIAWVKRRRNEGFDESDWQELPPPADG
jgi:hypothetical protein